MANCYTRCKRLSSQPSWGVDCSDNGEFIATSGKDNAVNIWQSDGNFIRTVRGHGATIRDVALGSDGTLALSASDDGTARLWQRHQYLSRPMRSHRETVWGLAVSPDSQLVASVSEAEGILFWKKFPAGAPTAPQSGKSDLCRRRPNAFDLGVFESDAICRRAPVTVTASNDPPLASRNGGWHSLWARYSVG